MTLLRILSLAVAVISVSRADDLSDDLLAAARKSDVAQVKLLLDKGANVNSKSPYGSTPLFFACDRGNLEVAKLLVDRGADVNVEDTFYHASALSWAVSKGHVEIVKLLLDHGAKSPGDVVAAGAQMGNVQMLKLGLSKGPIDAAVLSSSLESATKAKKTEIVDLLTTAGAKMPEPEKTVELDPAVLQSYVGKYLGGRGGTEFEMVIVVKGPALSGAFGPQPAITYAPSDKTHFHSIEVKGINLEFSADGFTLKQGGQVIEMKKKVESK